MNLGAIYIRAGLVILLAGIILGAIVTVVFMLARRRHLYVSTVLYGAIFTGIPLGSIGLVFGHPTLFSVWHRLQNEAVPATDCLSYEPSFWHLYASYRMNAESMAAWVATHPWGLKECEADAVFELHDGPHFGLKSCEAVYESPRGPKGNNLRVYYSGGIVYLSYGVM
jgi:hypothetical protein